MGSVTEDNHLDAGAFACEASSVQVVTTDEDSHLFELNEAALSQLLLSPEVCDKPVCVVSVAGAFRKGKSFLLNFLLRYLQKVNKLNVTAENWFGSDTETLTGFSWRGGSERETSGILFWNQPFLIKKPSGEEVVIILMDTQGAFDSQSTVKDCATIFALSTMLSSLQIYNLSHNIQEDDLQHLQLFTEYGRLALEDTDAKPFQSLLFLVRDWSFPYEAEYGFNGGSSILERRLQVSDRQHHELQQLRKHIRSCFTDISCFLLPHPGLKVATSPEFRGQIKDIEFEFRRQLHALISDILSPEKLIVKQIDGQAVKCRDLMAYFKVYIKIFQGEELPEPKSMLLATAEANNLAAVFDAKAVYCKGMEEVCGGDTPYLATDKLAHEHEKCYNRAVKQFVDKRKMGGAEYSQTFLEKLDIDLHESYENFVKINNGKNLFRSARTPAVLFLLLLIDYFFQQLFAFIYLDALATTCGTLLGLILLVLCLWAYVRYSGNFRDLGVAIDEIAGLLWENVFSPMSAFLMQEGVKHAVSLHRSVSSSSTLSTTGSQQMSVQRNVRTASSQHNSKKSN